MKSITSGIDVDRVPRVEQHMSAARNLPERRVEDRPVEEAQLARELEAVDVARDVLFHDVPQRPLEIAGQDERHADHEPDDHADRADR